MAEYRDAKEERVLISSSQSGNIGHATLIALHSASCRRPPTKKHATDAWVRRKHEILTSKTERASQADQIGVLGSMALGIMWGTLPRPYTFPMWLAGLPIKL